MFAFNITSNVFITPPSKNLFPILPSDVARLQGFLHSKVCILRILLFYKFLLLLNKPLGLNLFLLSVLCFNRFIDSVPLLPYQGRVVILKYKLKSFILTFLCNVLLKYFYFQFFFLILSG